MTATPKPQPQALVATQAARNPSRCTSPTVPTGDVRGLTINVLIWINTWNGGTL